MILPKNVLKAGINSKARRWPAGKWGFWVHVPYVIEGAYSKYAESTGFDGKCRPLKNHALQAQPSETSLGKLLTRLMTSQGITSNGLSEQLKVTMWLSEEKRGVGLLSGGRVAGR